MLKVTSIREAEDDPNGVQDKDTLDYLNGDHPLSLNDCFP